MTRFGSVRFLMLSVRVGSVQPPQNFHRFRFGSVFKILVSVRFNFSKTSTDPNTGWNATRFIIQYIDVDKNENNQNDREFDALPESIIGLIKNSF